MSTERNSVLTPINVEVYLSGHTTCSTNHYMPYAPYFDLTAAANDHVTRNMTDAGNGLRATDIEDKFKGINERLKKGHVNTWYWLFPSFISIIIGLITGIIAEQHCEYRGGIPSQSMMSECNAKSVLRYPFAVVGFAGNMIGFIYAYYRRSRINSIVKEEFQDWIIRGITVSSKLIRGEYTADINSGYIRGVMLTLQTQAVLSTTSNRI